MKARDIIAWKVSHADPTIASVRYRCLIPIRHLEPHFVSRFYARNDTIDFSEPLKALVFVKSFADRDLKTLLKAKNKNIPVFIDLCDNIFDRPPKEASSKNTSLEVMLHNLREMAKNADAIITTGEVLAARIRTETNSTIPIHIIPDSLEDREDVLFAQKMCADQRRAWMFDHGWLWIFTSVLPRIFLSIGRAIVSRPKHLFVNFWNHVQLMVSPPEKRTQHQPTSIVRATVEEAQQGIPAGSRRLLWFGHSGIPGAFGLTDLLELQAPLESLSNKYNLVLIVISNNHERYSKYVKPVFSFPTIYRDWSIETIENHIRECDITLVPNPLNKFSIAKSPNRSMLSLSYGVPVVATRTPALECFDGCLLFDEWETNIARYFDDPDLAQSHVAKGQDLLRKQFSGKALAAQWQRLFSFSLEKPENVSTLAPIPMGGLT